MAFQTYSSHKLSQESISRHKKKISSTKQISHIIEPHMPITYANNKPLPKPVPQTRATRNERTNEQNKDRFMMGQEMVPRRTDCQPFGRKDGSFLVPPHQHHKTVILNGKVNACVCVFVRITSLAHQNAIFLLHIFVLSLCQARSILGAGN